MGKEQHIRGAAKDLIAKTSLDLEEYKIDVALKSDAWPDFYGNNKKELYLIKTYNILLAVLAEYDKKGVPICKIHNVTAKEIGNYIRLPDNYFSILRELESEGHIYFKDLDMNWELFEIKMCHINLSRCATYTKNRAMNN